MAVQEKQEMANAVAIIAKVDICRVNTERTGLDR